jgi:N,N'-diacetyllegionaminate synthase
MKILAEFCQNHNGDMAILKDMIWSAAEAGATHGKIQTIFSNDLSFREEFENGATDSNGNVITIKRPYKAEYDRLKGLELEYEQHEKFISECNKANLVPLTTAFNLASVSHLKDMGWNNVKVASYDCASLPLIELLSDSFEELIISTGATYDDEIEKTAKYLNENNKNFSFLHCVTIYPTPLKDMHLNRMNYLRKFTDSVGLSEHSKVSESGVKACLAAIYLGAEIIERHFTVLDESMTKDGPVSITASHIEEIVAFDNMSKSDQKQYIDENIPEYTDMLGNKTRELSGGELLNRAYYRGRFCNKANDKQIYNWQEEAREIYEKG